MSKTLVLITGANQGLGYYAAQQLAASGKYHVIIGSRDVSKGETAIKSLVADTSYKVDAQNLETIQIDADSDESIKAAAETVQQQHGHLDILMLNAGIFLPQTATPERSLRQLYQQHYNTNLFGAVVTLDAFLPLLRRSSRPDGKRIAFTSSGLASLAWAAPGAQPPTPNPAAYSAKNYPLYRSTKTAMSMVMLHYATTLEEEGFVVAAGDPGYCATNLNSHAGMKDPREGAKELIKAATGSKDEVHARTVGDYGVMAW